MAPAGPPEDRPVAIQVGGRTFATRLSTLHKYPEGLLWRAHQFDARQFDLVFWDRCPKVFECLLEFYRTGRLRLPRDVGLAQIRAELEFWGFDVAPPERPGWPVVPLHPRRPPPGGSPRILYPLGVALRDASSGCAAVLICLLWSALGRCSAVWEAAQRGHRSLCLYWKGRCPGVDGSFVVNHLSLLQTLAELDGCAVEYLGEVANNAVSPLARSHDVYTHGHLHSAERPLHVAECVFDARLRVEGHEVVLTAEAEARFEFRHRGFWVTLCVEGERVWWYMDPLDADGDKPLLDGGDAVDARTLPDCGGFLLEVSFLVGRRLLAGFTLPSCYCRTGYLRADVFLTTSYDPPPEAGSEWYRSPGRCDVPSESACGVDAEGGRAQSVRMLVEEKQGASLVCHPVGSVLTFSAAAFSVPPTSSYDRIRVSW
jgi:hypothetical protein